LTSERAARGIFFASSFRERRSFFYRSGFEEIIEGKHFRVDCAFS